MVEEREGGDEGDVNDCQHHEKNIQTNRQNKHTSLYK